MGIFPVSGKAIAAVQLPDRLVPALAPHPEQTVVSQEQTRQDGTLFQLRLRLPQRAVLNMSAVLSL